MGAIFGRAQLESREKRAVGRAADTGARQTVVYNLNKEKKTNKVGQSIRRDLESLTSVAVAVAAAAGSSKFWHDPDTQPDK